MSKQSSKLQLVTLLVLFCISAAESLFAQAPDIKYNTPQIYVVGSSISSLAPVNSGGIVPANVYAEVTTFAGSGAQGSDNGAAVNASFNLLQGIAFDSHGNLFIADAGNHLIREATPTGVVSTFAGSGIAGSADGTGTNAQFDQPFGIAIDKNDNLYVTDAKSNLIRFITPAGIVTTFAGSGASGSANGAKLAASFNTPTGIVIDGAGNIFVADRANHVIREISAGTVSNFAGSGNAGSANGVGSAASFGLLMGMTIGADGSIYAADYNNNLIRKITAAGVVSTYAGNGNASSTNGPAASASFNYPFGVTIDAAGNIYVADGSDYIREINSSGIVSSLAGNGVEETGNGTGGLASFFSPMGIVADAKGFLYVTELDNLIRRVSYTGFSIDKILPFGISFNLATGIISGTASGISPSINYTITAYNIFGSSSSVLNMQVQGPASPKISYSASSYSFTVGNPINLSPVNTGGPVPATPYGQTSTFAGTGDNHSMDGVGTAASTWGPRGIAMDAAHNLFVAEQESGYIRKITPDANVTTIVGPGALPFGIYEGAAVDASGNLYVADNSNAIIRKITPQRVVTTFAGGTLGFADGTGTSAQFNRPSGMAADDAGNIYVADGNRAIRKITPAGVVTTLAGSGNNGSTNGAGTVATFSTILGLGVDKNRNVYVADVQNSLVRKVTPDGIVTTFAGNGTFGHADGLGTAAILNAPNGLTVDPAGNVYVSDAGDNQIREITPNGQVTTLAGTGQRGSANGPGRSSSFNNAQGMAADGSGNLFIADFDNNLIRKTVVTGYSITPNLPAGLSFDNTTGVISGQFSGLSPATDYTVIAYNVGGSSATTINITGISKTPAAITSFSPAIAMPGATVNITGSNLTGATAVSFGGTPATSFTVVSATNITAVVASGASGDISITTPNGVATHSGFTFLFDLPADNFTLSATSASCKGTADGMIYITAKQNLNYTATVTAGNTTNTYLFNTAKSITALAAATYHVCITVAGQPNYQQCYDLVVTEPKDLSVYSEVDPVLNNVTLTLSGADQYNIQLNDNSYTTSNSSITLTLAKGDNKLSVSTDKFCQGIVQKLINISDRVIPYPDPFQNTLNINLGNKTTANAGIKISSLTDGKIVMDRDLANQSGIIQLDVSKLASGVYVLHLNLNGTLSTFKIIKK